VLTHTRNLHSLSDTAEAQNNHKTSTALRTARKNCLASDPTLDGKTYYSAGSPLKPETSSPSSWLIPLTQGPLVRVNMAELTANSALAWTTVSFTLRAQSSSAHPAQAKNTLGKTTSSDHKLRLLFEDRLLFELRPIVPSVDQDPQSKKSFSRRTPARALPPPPRTPPAGSFSRARRPRWRTAALDGSTGTCCSASAT